MAVAANPVVQHIHVIHPKTKPAKNRPQRNLLVLALRVQRRITSLSHAVLGDGDVNSLLTRYPEAAREPGLANLLCNCGCEWNPA